jgi:hypothetical protein
VGEPQPAGGPGASGTAIPARRFRLALPATATLLGVAAVVLTALGVILADLAHQLTFLSTWAGIPVFLGYAGVGVVIARRQPGNPVAWALIGFVLLAMISSDAGYYAVYCYRPGHHGLPLAAAAAALVPLFLPAIALFPIVILLFPDGRLASPRWRWVLWAYAGLVAWATAATLAQTIAAVASHHVRLDSTGDVITKGHPASDGIQGVVLVAVLAIWLSFVAHQVLRWRRASGERRQQLKWLACGGAVTLVTFIGATAAGFTTVLGEVLSLGLIALPLSIGVGILKYRLYEIDRIISRTLAYALVTGLLVGVYAALVLLATQVLSVSSPVAVAASTLAAAALFTPLRRRVQGAVDRRFNRARYDADRMLAQFADHLKDAVDLDWVRADLARVVQQALEPAHTSVWTINGPPAQGGTPAAPPGR